MYSNSPLRQFMFPWEMGSFTLGLMVLCVYVAPFLVPGGAVVVSSLATVGALLVARKHKKVRVDCGSKYSSITIVALFS